MGIVPPETSCLPLLVNWYIVASPTWLDALKLIGVSTGAASTWCIPSSVRTSPSRVRLDPAFWSAYTNTCAVPHPHSDSIVIWVPGWYLWIVAMQSAASLFEAAAFGPGANTTFDASYGTALMKLSVASVCRPRMRFVGSASCATIAVT